MDDLDLQLDAFAARQRPRLRRDLMLAASLPLLVGLLAGAVLGRATARGRVTVVQSECRHAARTGSVFSLDVDHGGLRMNVANPDDE